MNGILFKACLSADREVRRLPLLITHKTPCGSLAGAGQIDSVSVAKLKALAQSESDIALYSLAALELRGDTLIKRHPEESYGGSSQRLSSPKETKELIKESKLLIYPNPGKGIFNLKMNSFVGQAELFVFDLTGRLMLRKKEIFVENNPVQLNLNEYKSGIYFVELRQNGVFKSAGKIIIE
jgi:hypothetical protein